MKTLLVTPAPDVRSRFEPVLRARGQDVTAVADLAGALDALAAGPFELGVVDLTAPGPEGLEVCRRLRGTPGGSWCVLLVITPSSRSRALEEAVRLGADDYLLPTEEAELLDLRLAIADRKVQDNAARRRTLEALTQSEGRFRHLLESAPDALFLVGADGRVELMNAQGERLSGYARSELLGQPVEVLVPEALREAHVGHRRQFFGRPATRRLGAGLNLGLRRKDGAELPVDISLAPQSEGGRPYAIAAVRDITEHRRLEEELRRAREVAERAYERVHRDLEVAALVQRSLLPARLPADERFRFAWEYLPCAELGGDGLNVFRLGEHAVGLYLLDVSGHGAPAALLSVNLARLLSPVTEQSTFLCVPEERGGGCRALPPAEVARRLNRWLLAGPTGGQFVTLVYAVLDTQTGLLRYVSAGHPPLLLAGPDGSPSAHSSTGPPVGCFEDAEFDEGELALAPGDRLFLYSDGVLGAFNDSGSSYGPAAGRHPGGPRRPAGAPGQRPRRLGAGVGGWLPAGRRVRPGRGGRRRCHPAARPRLSRQPEVDLLGRQAPGWEGTRQEPTDYTAAVASPRTLPA
jgi:phosphoserine phosphatase RsbU/P